MKRQQISPKKWNVLVYLAGDNNLSEEMVWSLQEMKKTASEALVANAVNVATLFDPRGERERRYDIITPDRRPASASDGELEDFVAGAPARKGRELVRALVGRFLKWGVERLPRARHLAVVLSGHGSGAVGDFLPDDDPSSALSIPKLGSVLKKTTKLTASKIDILGMDSCQMSSIETAVEVEGSVHYLIASEGLVLNAGWPYHRVLEVLTTSGPSAKSTARAVAARYLAFYSDYELVGLSTDIAVTDLARIGPVADGVRDLSVAMKAPLAKLAADGIEEALELQELERTKPDAEADFSRSVRDVVVLAHASAQSYKCDRYVDLGDFVEQLLRFGRGWGNDARTEPIVAAAKRLRSAIDEAVVLSGTTGAEFQHSRGLSIYFPWSSGDYLPEYRNLRFSKRTKWADFLETYLRATVRMRRHQAAHVTKARPRKGVARGRDGLEIVPTRPRHISESSLEGWKDVDAGTHRDVDAGTHRGKACRSTMKNPPEGHYDGPREDGEDGQPGTK